MIKERIVWMVALVLVAGAGFFGGQRLGVAQGLQERQQAASQFYGNRGGGQAGGQNNAAGRGLFGTVTAINGNDITLAARDGTTTTVELGSGGTIRKQVNGQWSDIHTGDRVTAMGTLNGTTFQATTITDSGSSSGRQTQ